MIEALIIFVGGFIALIGLFGLYCFLFDKDRWGKAVASGRVAGAESRAKSKVKNDERERRRLKKAAELTEWAESKQQALETKLQEQRDARAEAKKIAEENRVAGMATGQPRRSRAGGLSRANPMLGNMIGGIAAASLVEDIKEALDDDDSEVDSQADNNGSDGDW